MSQVPVFASFFPAFSSPETAARLRDTTLGFETIDGEFISREDGEAALRCGAAVIVGGLLVGFVSSCGGMY